MHVWFSLGWPVAQLRYVDGFPSYHVVEPFEVAVSLYNPNQCSSQHVLYKRKVHTFIIISSSNYVSVCNSTAKRSVAEVAYDLKNGMI